MSKKSTTKIFYDFIYSELTGYVIGSQRKKATVTVKSEIVRYWNFEFLNWKGERMFYHCVAPNFQLAYKSLLKYLDGCTYEVVSCSTDGETFCLQ